MKVAGIWRYVYRAVDQDGQVLDVFVSNRRDTAAAEWFFAKALRDHGEPLEIVTDKSPTLAAVIADLAADSAHTSDQYANNRIECDRGRLKARLRPMRGLKTDRTASTVIRGHAFVQNLRRGPLPVRPRRRSRGATRGGVRRATLGALSLSPSRRLDQVTRRQCSMQQRPRGRFSPSSFQPSVAKTARLHSTESRHSPRQRRRPSPGQADEHLLASAPWSATPRTCQTTRASSSRSAAGSCSEKGAIPMSAVR